MNLPEPRHHQARGVQIVAVRFRKKTSVEEVVARLLEAVRRTDLFLLKVFGDGNRLYPFAGRNPARTASSWRAELSWSSAAVDLEVFLKRAELFLELPGRLRLEIGGGRRNPREDVHRVRRARLSGAGDEAPTPLDKKS